MSMDGDIYSVSESCLISKGLSRTQNLNETEINIMDKVFFYKKKS